MRADMHDGPEHMLQSEAGYIDARPADTSSTKPLATHGRTIHSAGHFRSAPINGHRQTGPAGPVRAQEPTWRQIERGQFAGVSGTNALHCTGTTRRTPHHSRCLCSVSLELSSAITVYPIVHSLQSKQSDQGDLFL